MYIPFLFPTIVLFIFYDLFLGQYKDNQEWIITRDVQEIRMVSYVYRSLIW